MQRLDGLRISVRRVKLVSKAFKRNHFSASRLSERTHQLCEPFIKCCNRPYGMSLLYGSPTAPGSSVNEPDSISDAALVAYSLGIRQAPLPEGASAKRL